MRREDGTLLIALLIGIAAIVGTYFIVTSDEAPGPRLPRGPNPAQVHRLQAKAVADCNGITSEREHHIGSCAPPSVKSALQRPSAALQARQRNTCPDLSNNDPTNNWAAIRAHGHPCGWVKLGEGVGFIDRTAPAMIAAAKRAGVLVGGYWFSHVCLVSATAEGNLFADYILRYGLTLQSAIDVEYGGNGCNATSWIATEYNTVVQRIRQRLGAYSGGWWLQPHAPRLFAVLKSLWVWLSGYPNASPCCGRSSIDVHQFSDRTFNGANVGDMSVLNVSLDSLRVGKPTPVIPAKVTALCNDALKLWKRRTKQHGLHAYGKRRLHEIYAAVAKLHYGCHLSGPRRV